MSHGMHAVYGATVSSFATSSSAIDLGRAYRNVYVEIPVMTSGATLHIQGSGDGSTFRRVHHPSINSATVANNVFTILSSVTNSIVPIPAGFRHLKIECAAVISFTAAFKIICSD